MSKAAAAAGKAKKKIKRSVSDGIAHVQASFNNTVAWFHGVSTTGLRRRSP